MTICSSLESSLLLLLQIKFIWFYIRYKEGRFLQRRLQMSTANYVMPTSSQKQQEKKQNNAILAADESYLLFA